MPNVQVIYINILQWHQMKASLDLPSSSSGFETIIAEFLRLLSMFYF